MREYLLCLLAAAAVTYLTVPLSRRLAVRWGAPAEGRGPDGHHKPTPPGRPPPAGAGLPSG